MRPHDFDLALEPSRTYPYVYPLPNESLMRLAYSFEDTKRKQHMHRALSDEPGQQQLREVVMQWNDVWRTTKPVLQVYDDGDGLRIIDTRPCAIQGNWTIRGVAADVYRLCDSAQPISLLKSRLGDGIEPALDTLLSNKIMLSMHDKLLSIGVALRNPG